MRPAHAPLFVGGTGGSGTRAVAGYLAEAGLFAGTELNESMDAMPLARFYDAHLDELLGGSAVAWREAFDMALAQHLGDRRGPWFAKNPRSIFVFERLLDASPGARYLHVVRNGVDMAFSSNQRQLDLHGSRFPELLPAGEPRCAHSLRLWAHLNLVARQSSARFPGRYALLRYEDFCASPRRQMERVGAQLGLQLDHGRVAAEAVSPSERRLPEDWREQLGEALAVARPALEHFGYPC